jgi:hypothetical protein
LVNDQIEWARFDRALEEGFIPALRETIFAGSRASRRPLETALGRKIKKQVTATQTIDLQLRNLRAEEWVNAEAALLVREVSNETRLAVQSIIMRGQQEGLSVAQQGRLIRQHIGLTQRGEEAVLNRMALLRRQGLSDEAVEAAGRRYYEKLVRQRAQLIARTETIRAANRGQQALWEQAMVEGFLDLERKKVWIVTPDDRLCPLCEGMEGQTVPVSQPFNSPLGPVMTPDLHPGCRCAMALEATT